MYELLFKYFNDRVGIDRKDFDNFSHHFKPLKVKRNEFLLQLGKTCKHNYFVTAGCLRFFTTNQDGQEVTRYFAFEGSCGTALTSFIEQTPSFEYIQSIQKSEVLAITRKDFYDLVDENKHVGSIYKDILEKAYITSQKRIYGLQGDSALDRLKWLMNYQPKILGKLSNRVIASYLGVTPYTLSRLKSEL